MVDGKAILKCSNCGREFGEEELAGHLSNCQAEKAARFHALKMETAKRRKPGLSMKDRFLKTASQRSRMKKFER